MEIKRKFELQIETNRRYIVRRSSAEEPIVCGECSEPMLTGNQAANVFNIKQRRIFQIIEAEAVHFTETEAGVVMICLNSLAKFLIAKTE